jgi:glycerophosphoryl diester phosphodiesterase
LIWQKSNIRTWLPRLQCHRGYWVKGELQNSLHSVRRAYEYGYDICEFDVRLTADRCLILFHDAKFNNKFVSDTLFSDLAEQVEVTTLRQLFEWFVKTQNFKLNIEIKNDNILNYEIEKQVCDLVKEFNVTERVLVSSFNPLSLTKLRFLNPQIFRALLLSFENEHGNNWFVMSGVMNYFCYPQALHLRYQDFLKHRAHFKKLAKKIPIVLWTVNDLQIYFENRDLVYGIISDSITPEEMKKEN